MYDKLSLDRSIALSLLLVIGAVLQIKNLVNSCLNDFQEFSWRWTEDVEETYFTGRKNPVLGDLTSELDRFMAAEQIWKVFPT